MKLIAILITNNIATYGGVSPIRQAVLFVCIPDSVGKNTLGDVVAISDDMGNIVGSYEYNAWGEIAYQYGSIAEINPFRYRGYYYDVETGFYYLQTRYYDPTICRFINADNYELVSQLASVPGQLNLYAYCGNNPIMYTDETGEFWNWLIGAAVGAVAGFVGQVISDVITSFTTGTVAISNWQTYAGSVLGGAIGGAILGGTGNVSLANAAMGFATTGIGLSLEKLTGGSDKSWLEIGLNALADGAISYGLGKIAVKTGITNGKYSMSAVYRSGLTKLRNGTASHMSLKVIGKGTIAGIVGGVPMDIYYGIKQSIYMPIREFILGW